MNWTFAASSAAAVVVIVVVVDQSSEAWLTFEQSMNTK